MLETMQSNCILLKAYKSYNRWKNVWQNFIMLNLIYIIYQFHSHLPPLQIKAYVNKMICIRRFIVALVITQNWKQHKYPSTGKWINKLWYSHIMQYYLWIKRNKPTMQTKRLINRKNIILNERSQTQRNVYSMTLFTWSIGKINVWS